MSILISPHSGHAIHAVVQVPLFVLAVTTEQEMANVMVKHHAQGELPPWVFFVFGEAQVGGIQPV